MMPEGDPDSDGLTREQFRWLAFVAVAIGALLLLAIIGITAASVLWGGGGTGTPTAAFQVETVERDDGFAANVTHAGGDAVNPEAIVIEVNGEPRGTWEELGGEGPDVVASGFRLQLDGLAAGDSVTVVWTGSDDRVELGSGTIG